MDGVGHLAHIAQEVIRQTDDDQHRDAAYPDVLARGEGVGRLDIRPLGVRRIGLRAREVLDNRVHLYQGGGPVAVSKRGGLVHSPLIRERDHLHARGQKRRVDLIPGAHHLRLAVRQAAVDQALHVGIDQRQPRVVGCQRRRTLTSIRGHIRRPHRAQAQLVQGGVDCIQLHELRQLVGVQVGKRRRRCTRLTPRDPTHDEQQEHHHAKSGQQLAPDSVSIPSSLIDRRSPS